MAIEVRSMRTQPDRCHSLRHLLTLSRAAPTMFPNSRWDYLNPIGGPAERLDIGHTQHYLGKSYRQLLHSYFSHLPVGRTQSVTKHLDYPGPHVGVPLQEFQDIAAV